MAKTPLQLKDIFVRNGKVTTGAKIAAGAAVVGTAGLLLLKKKKNKQPEVQPEDKSSFNQQTTLTADVSTIQQTPFKKSRLPLIIGGVLGVTAIGFFIYFSTSKK